MYEVFQFSAEHYRQKLKEYAKDTIEIRAFNGLFTYKVNKNDNPTVVENIDDHFKVYTSEKPKVSIAIWETPQTNFRDNFFAEIYIVDNVEIKVRLRRFYKIGYLIFGLITFGLNIITVLNGDFAFLMFSPILLILGVYLLVSKRRYKSFIIAFLNNL